MTRWPESRLPMIGIGASPPVPPFTVNLVPLVPLIYELGADVINPTFNLLEGGAIGPLILRTVTDDDGNPPQNFLGVPNPVTMPFTYNKAAIGGSVAFDYTADDGSGPVSDIETFLWQPRVYFGVAPVPGAVNEAFIEGLSDSELRADRGIDRTGVVWTAAEYLWVAFPQAFNPTVGTDFLVTVGGAGFPGGFLLDTAGVSVTPNTPGGVPILYDVWRSTGSGIGLTIDLTVSP